MVGSEFFKSAEGSSMFLSSKVSTQNRLRGGIMFAFLCIHHSNTLAVISLGCGGISHALLAFGALHRETSEIP